MTEHVELLANLDFLEETMQKALDQAQLSIPSDVPIGAVIVNMSNKEVIASAHNQRELHCNSIRHAEITAIEQACAVIGDWRLNEYCIFTTLEPCVMCAGALVQSRIGAVVYGAVDDQFGAGGSIYNFFEDPRLNHNPEVVRGVLKDKCQHLIDDFFQERRSSD